MKGWRAARSRVYFAALLLLSGWAPAHAALRLQLDTRGLEPAQVVASQELLDQALARLPPGFKDSMDQQVVVRWDEVLPHDAWGRAEHRELLLNRRLLDGLTDGTAAGRASRRDATRTDRSQRDELIATVLHELAHFHDRVHGLSDDPRLLDLAGWQVKARWFGARQSENRFVDRSPDPYELTSPREFVAVNLEYFLLDPSYACRRPGLHRFFRDHFGWAPSHPQCPQGFVYLNAGSAAGDDASGTPQVLNVLDPERVYAVEYLLAEGNEQLMSRWGHSMLRLVVCAPGRPRGPGCRLDLQHHLVLSFRAFVNDVQLSSWRGLTGSYPSRLFVLPLEQVVEEYTKDQLRALQSIPLALDRSQIEGLLERAAKLHWSYDGRYYFVSNNCAVETFKLLHDGVPQLAQAGLAAITPTGLLTKLDRRDLADTSVLDDPHEARRLGYRFDSFRERFQVMFVVARQELGLPQSEVEDWLALPPGERRVWFDQAGLRASAALLLLEQAALRRQVLLAQEDLKRRYLGAMMAGRDDGPNRQPNAAEDPLPAGQTAPGGEPADAGARLRQILQHSGFLSRPAGLLAASDGYGLPQPAEIQRLALESGRRKARLDELNLQLRNEVKALLDPDLRANLERTRDNVDALGERLRVLNQRDSGLDLP
ncbi:DUF7844 domain-containing protein [Lysobacter sp. A378]